jgi:hypothetical protein
MVLDFVSFLVVVLVVVEASWPKLNMLSRPRNTANISNFFVIFIRILSIAGIGAAPRANTIEPQGKNSPAKANPAGVGMSRK